VFFNSPKQNERLEEVQHQLLSRYEDPEVNQDVLNSSIVALADQGPSNPNLSDLTSDNEIGEAAIYVSLKIRLKELKDSIKHVIFKLSLETNKEAKKDHEILKKRFLKYWKWDLLDRLLELFKPIEEATEWFGGQKYCMLLLIYPTIQVLKYNYVVVEEENDEETDNDAEEETKDETKKEIDNSVLLASILDPRIKESLNSSQEPNNKNKLKEKTISNFKLRLFEEEEEEEIINNDEINNYLDRFQTPQANSNENLFKW
ncbi:23458_t:CDS:2, partial [Gigaspora margarita]